MSYSYAQDVFDNVVRLGKDPKTDDIEDVLYEHTDERALSGGLTTTQVAQFIGELLPRRTKFLSGAVFECRRLETWAEGGDGIATSHSMRPYLGRKLVDVRLQDLIVLQDGVHWKIHVFIRKGEAWTHVWTLPCGVPDTAFGRRLAFGAVAPAEELLSLMTRHDLWPRDVVLHSGEKSSEWKCFSRIGRWGYSYSRLTDGVESDVDKDFESYVQTSVIDGATFVALLDYRHGCAMAGVVGLHLWEGVDYASLVTALEEATTVPGFYASMR